MDLLSARRLANELGVSPLLGQCLINRGFSDRVLAQKFLAPRLKDLADPFLLPDMDKAVDRLILARVRQESVVIFGDYDVDGITSCALLKESLEKLGWKVSCFLPERFGDGYGLTLPAVAKCLELFPATVLLAVDCGSTASNVIASLKAQAVEVIVLDHHEVASPAPSALALVNPKTAARSDPPFGELCSAGLAFKLVHALLKKLRAENCPEALSFDLKMVLDLVALGTIADLVPLRGENRIFAAVGLHALTQSQRCGVAALKISAGLKGDVGCREVAFQFAPRLNAAGRVADAQIALSLLLTHDSSEAQDLAARLETRNRERQEIEKGIVDELLARLEKQFDPATDFFIVEGDQSWHVGVVGIVASRILHHFYRPTLIFGGVGEEWRGSARSILGLDLASAFVECSDLFLRHGGHSMAAGVSMNPDNLEQVRFRLNALARTRLNPQDFSPSLSLDAEVGLEDLQINGVKELERLQPSGIGNPQVQVVVRNLRLQGQPQRMGKEEQHLNFWVTDGKNRARAVWWRAPSNCLTGDTLDLACVPELNEYKGLQSVQLKVLDCQPSPAPTVAHANPVMTSVRAQ